MRPTLEQHAVGWLFDQGESMVVEAGAGTGKTSTLVMLAEQAEDRTGRYLAFNKAIVTDVQDRLPPNCGASTAHALAFRAVGKHYQHRLGSYRMKSKEIARLLSIRGLAFQAEGIGAKRLSEAYLGGLVMRTLTRFCQTADPAPTGEHVPFVPGIDPPGARGVAAENNALLRYELEEAITAAWVDISKRDGGLTFKHEHYLKLYQLGLPRIEADFILFDEAQDANPVMAAIVGTQDHAQIVWVGDANQAIYEWTGAVNAIEGMKAAGLPTRQLSQSFRFGAAIADAANRILDDLGAGLRLTGRDDLASELRTLDRPDAILCRTNAQAVTEILYAQRSEVSAHLVGGGEEVISFAKAAAQLKRGELCWHPDLACFDSWPEVVAYVRDDAQGGELRLLVSLVEEFGVPTILRALEVMPDEDSAALVVSTAHKAKGREWDSVRIAPDFADTDEMDDSELRLRYVAVTRARLALDMTALDAQKEPQL